MVSNHFLDCFGSFSYWCGPFQIISDFFWTVSDHFPTAFYCFHFIFSPEPETPPPGHHLRKIKTRKSLTDRKIARIAPMLIIFEPKSSQQRDLFFENKSNERKNKETHKKTERMNEQSHRPGRRHGRSRLRFL